MNRKEKTKAIYKKLADKTWTLWCRFLIKWEPNETNDFLAYEIIYVQPRWSSTYTVIDWVVQTQGMHTSDYKNPEFCYKWYKWVNYIDFTKVSQEDFYEKVDTIGHPVTINVVEFHLNETDYNEIKKLVTKKELLEPIDWWNEEAFNLLYEKTLNY